MKKIREIDLAKQHAAASCTSCGKAVSKDGLDFWTQVGFQYRCLPSSPSN